MKLGIQELLLILAPFIITMVAVFFLLKSNNTKKNKINGNHKPTETG